MRPQLRFSSVRVPAFLSVVPSVLFLRLRKQSGLTEARGQGQQGLPGPGNRSSSWRRGHAGDPRTRVQAPAPLLTGRGGGMLTPEHGLWPPRGLGAKPTAGPLEAETAESKSKRSGLQGMVEVVNRVTREFAVNPDSCHVQADPGVPFAGRSSVWSSLHPFPWAASPLGSDLPRARVCQ